MEPWKIWKVPNYQPSRSLILLAGPKDISQHYFHQLGYILTVSPDGKIIDLMIILFQYSFNGAI